MAGVIGCGATTHQWPCCGKLPAEASSATYSVRLGIHDHAAEQFKPTRIIQVDLKRYWVDQRYASRLANEKISAIQRRIDLVAHYINGATVSF